MKIQKVPLMTKKEYDELIKELYVIRIGFKGEYLYMAPFIYVFDGGSRYLLKKHNLNKYLKELLNNMCFIHRI
jgi:nitroimidazol reductase NimA-like FMN-containing flavoprotein (pyridoxamine 5'-phosphate oxidase superfamily)